MPEVIFKKELEFFRIDVESGIQYFSAYLAIHNIASQQKAIERILNSAPLFWKTNLSALQSSTFITLGRIFDTRQNHNLSRLINLAERNQKIFSLKALARRKQGKSADEPEWLKKYLRGCYEPTTLDFRQLKKITAKWRTVYEKNYRNIRNQIYAHKEVVEREDVLILFQQTNIDELHNIFLFLWELYNVLWSLYHNGHKPDFMSTPMVSTVQETITKEVEHFLLAVSGELNSER
jgi:hypothetical protein